MNEKFSILHEAKLSAVLKISVSNPFNIQSEFTAGDDLQFLPARPEHCTVFMRYCNNALCHFDVAR